MFAFDLSHHQIGDDIEADLLRRNFNALNKRIDGISVPLQGSPGEVSSQKLSDVIAGTSTIQLLDINADLPAIIAILNEMIQAQRR
ncbi:MAG: hypothetical protein HZA88_03635 [Verrucomicrobia bacterium]|nr:hypothetical protein [Verrucomicrobiota bacterium]